jgi:hypothetical protein
MAQTKAEAIKKLRFASTVGDLTATDLADNSVREAYQAHLSEYYAGGRTDEERDAAAGVRLQRLTQDVIDARD